MEVRMTAMARKQNRITPLLLVLLAGTLLLLTLFLSLAHEPRIGSEVERLRKQWEALGKPGIRALGEAPGHTDSQIGQEVLDFLEGLVDLEESLRSGTLSPEEREAVEEFVNDVHRARGELKKDSDTDKNN